MDFSKLGYLLIIQYLFQPHGLNNFLNRKYEGADIHAYNDWVLYWAAVNNHLQVLQYLVSIGANIHSDNDSALKTAAQNGHLHMVQYLVSVGANIHVLNEAVLRTAAENGHLKIVQFLVNPRIDSTVNPTNSRSALVNPTVNPTKSSSVLVNPGSNNFLNRKYDGPIFIIVMIGLYF